MSRIVGGVLVLVLGLSGAAGGDERQDNAGTPAEQYKSLAKEFHEAGHAFYLEATTDEDRVEPLARIINLSPRCLALAENNPKDPVALDALVQVVSQELWLDKEKLNCRSFVIQDAINAQWNQPGTPMYYVIDHEGVIRHKWFGSPGEKAIDAALDKLIEQAEGARCTAGADEPIASVYTGSPQPHECRP